MRERHLHLSGATSTTLLWELITQSGLKTTAKNYWEFEKTVLMNRSNVDSLDDYLAILHRLELAQSSPQAIEACFYDAFRSCYLSGVTEMELRWNPLKRSQSGALDLDRLIVAARSGYERAKMTYGIHGGMIFCLGRDMTEIENSAIWKMAMRYNGKGCTGIDIAGPEHKPLMDYAELKYIYAYAETLKLERTIHCAETLRDHTEAELEYVLTVLKPNRVGHGLQIHRYPKLMEIASKQNLHFEICISSNLATKAVESLEEYAQILKKFEEYKLDYSINTDSTFLLQTNLAKEHEIHEKIKGIARNSLK